MPGDRARVSYDPTRQWRGTVAQQGRVVIEADLNETETIIAERDRLTTLDVVGPVGTPDGGYQVTATPAGSPAPAIAGDLQIGPGTLYLGGERLDLDQPVSYSAQPDWLNFSSDPLWVPPAVPDSDGSSELVYLLAAEQEVSAVEDPALADVALGGPDTMQRLRVMQHFVRTPASSGSCGDAWSGLVGSLGGQGLTFDPASMMLESTSTLQVSLTTEPGSPSLCEPVATGGYLGAENQMIRVMVTGVDKKGVPTIVWGFDNASFIYRLLAATIDTSTGATTVTLASSPVDSFHYPALGQAVELLRDEVKLTATDYIAAPTGFVSSLTSAYDPTSGQLTFTGPPPADYLSAATPQLYLRVWQATAVAPANQAIPLDGTGLAVTLNSTTGAFHPGDFWTFAVRPIEPDIVYPARYLAAPQPPEGPRTWACPIAVLTWNGGSATATSCIPPFTGLTGISGGDCECTIDVRPADLAAAGSFAALVAPYVGQSPITLCFAPGTYTLAEPLVIGPGLDGITLRACRGGVVLQARPDPGPEFSLGLVVVQDATSVTISGIGLSLPLVFFRISGKAFAGLPPANQELMQLFSEVMLAIGISAVSVTGLTVRGCSFDFADPGRRVNVFGAGIYAFGAVDGLAVAECTFQATNPPVQVPFNDLAAGAKAARPPYQLTFGYLQLPTVRAPVDIATAGGAGAITPRSTAFALLHDGAIERCLFQGVTVPMLAMTRLGTLRIDQNTVRDCYGGFWLISMINQKTLTMFDVSAIGNPTIYNNMATLGQAALLDRIYVLASATGRVLPTAPVTTGEVVTGQILAPSLADLESARALFASAYAEAALGGAAAVAAPAPAGPAQAGARSFLPADINAAFEPLGAPAPEEPAPVADTGTSVSLRLDFCDCQVDAVIADSYSGAGLVIADFAQDTGSAVVHDSRIRTRFPEGEAVMANGLTEATVTGNIVANEVVPVLKQTGKQPNSYSIAMAVPTPLGIPAVAITGNVFIDPTRLPARPATIPQVLADWDVLNTVIDYVAPAGVAADLAPAPAPAEEPSPAPPVQAQAAQPRPATKAQRTAITRPYKRPDPPPPAEPGGEPEG